MRKFSRLMLVCIAVLALGVSGSVLANASGKRSGHHKTQSHHLHVSAHAKKADFAKDVADAKKDSADERGEANQAPDPAEEQKESADAGKENVDAGQEGDDAAQVAACAKAGVTGDNVQYDDQTGVCSAEHGQDNSSAGDGQENNHND